MITDIDDFFMGIYLGILVCAVLEYIFVKIDLRRMKNEK